MILGTSILVVDDDTEVRKTLFSILNEEGYSVETAENGKQAIKACERLSFDVALIDIEVPDMKGTELLERLKWKHPKMVKIVITGDPSLDNAIGAINEGAEGYILKPFDVQELLQVIKKHLDEKTAEQIRSWAENSQTQRERTRLY
jgi:DNA-binding NtrC family response regulator